MKTRVELVRLLVDAGLPEGIAQRMSDYELADAWAMLLDDDAEGLL